MMATYFNRVRFNTATIGAADVIPGPAYTAAFFTPSEAGAVNGDTPDYLIVEGNDVELGHGVIAAGVLQRTVIVSKIAGVVGTAKMVLAGNAEVSFVETAQELAATAAAIATNTANIATNTSNLAAHVVNTGNPHSVTKAQVGLGNVDNTSDANKPVSTAQAAAIALKADLASPTFTGDPKGPTPATADNDTSLATTAHVHAAIAADVVRSSTTEALTGTDAAKVVTPDALAALWERGADAAAASTITLTEGGWFFIASGSGNVNSILFNPQKAGRRAWVTVNNAGVTLVHNAAALILPGAANISCAVGDHFCVVSQTATISRVLAYVRADGSVLSAGTASTTEVLTGTDAAKAVTPDSLAALWEYTSIAVGTTITLTEGGFFNITGAAGVSISSIVFQTPKAGRSAWLWFVNSHTIVHGANLDCPGAQNLPIKDHDRVLISCTGASSYVVTAIERADGNIYFPATQQASSGVNCLDDYEEGTWTPTMAYATTQPTGQTANGSATYTKIGRMVSFEGRFTYTNKGSGGVGQLQLNGFPYAIAGLQIASIDRYANITLPSSGVGMWMFVTGSTFAEIHTRNNTSCPPITWNDVTNTTDLFFSGQYRAST